MDTSIFQHDDYRGFIQSRLHAMPRRGRGQIKRISEAAGLDASYLSRILRGSKGLKMEHSLPIARFLGLGALETDYLVELVRLDSAGNPELKKYSTGRLQQMREQAGMPAEEPRADHGLDARDEAIYLSNWQFDAARIATGIPGLGSIDALAEYLSLPRALVGQIVSFLLSSGLCMGSSGKLETGKKFLRLNPDSPMVARHLLNWRSAGTERLPARRPQDFFYTLSMAVSEKDADLLRKKLVGLVEEAHALSEKTIPERVACLNVDWFRV
ncbi:MAG TPA: hypothetical protein VM598_13360 [Bdellovibrionota bacterium]|nr:hypothetical protein [Bdellovibrionota bacterium]